MELLLSNPPRRKRAKSKRKTSRKVARRVSRRRRRRSAATTARKVPTMATKRKTRRRSRRRTYTKRRTTFRGHGRPGFVDMNLLTAGAAVAGGLIVGPMITAKLPASLTSNRYASPLIKAGIGLAVAKFGSKYNKALALSFAAGLIGSGVLEVVGPMISGAAPRLNGYEGDIVSSELGSYVIDGNTVDGYLTNQGEVVDPDTGGVVGHLQLDAA